MEAPKRTREFTFDLPVGLTGEDGGVERSVTLRKMTGKEEAILADRRYQRNGGKLVTELIHSCLLRIGDEPKNGRGSVAGMYSADRNYLLLKLRAITFGPELETTYTCPACNDTITVLEDLDALPVRRLSAGESAEDVAVELEDGYYDKEGQLHTSLILRLPTGADEEAVAPQLRKNASLGKNALLARCMKSLGDVPSHRLNALGTRIMQELTMTDRRLIDRALNDGAPGIDLVCTVDCTTCGHEFKTTLDLSRFLSLA
jgi:hypothetical protein